MPGELSHMYMYRYRCRHTAVLQFTTVCMHYFLLWCPSFLDAKLAAALQSAGNW